MVKWSNQIQNYFNKILDKGAIFRLFSQAIEVPVGSDPKPSFAHCSYRLQKYGHLFIFIVGLQ